MRLCACPRQCHTPHSMWHICFSCLKECGGHELASSESRQKPHWACLGPYGGLDLRHGWPPTYTAQNCGVLSPRRGRQWTLVQSMPHRVGAFVTARGRHTRWCGVVTWLYACLTDPAVFNDVIIVMRNISTVEFPSHFRLLFHQLQSQFAIGPQPIYQLWKPDISKFVLNKWIRSNLLAFRK